MPQISQLSETYASQVFWILLIFGFVFFVIGRGMVPKVMATVDLRDKRIADDLAAADAARKAADVEEAAWRAHSNEQRAEAQAIIAKAKTGAAQATAARLAQANAFLEGRLAAADSRISSARDGALGEIEAVASEAASDIVSRLAGITVDSDTSRAAVKEALHG